MGVEGVSRYVWDAWGVEMRLASSRMNRLCSEPGMSYSILPLITILYT